MPSVPFVLTAARKWSQKDGRQRPTGFWAEEFAAPHRILVEGGVDVTIATPGGLVPVPDESSLSLQVNNDDNEKVAELSSSLAKVQAPLDAPAKLEEIDPADFDGVLIPGGHGPIQDLAVNPTWPGSSPRCSETTARSSRRHATARRVSSAPGRPAGGCSRAGG
ncbi:hypothetical protein [Dactylosporangium sp. CA-233914]|uniref:hypothetical protein n=1 Tax=Dactylosporangium sp. CA-233914 TaxID=3239934 RepID=UPI003D8D8BD6